MNPGLFSDVYRYANFKTREPREVLLTAALSYCLESVPQFRILLLTRGCRGADIAMPRGPAPTNVHIAHQATYRRIDGDDHTHVRFDRPDIVVRYPSGAFSCAIECKLREAVSDDQAARYATQLLGSAEGNRCLLMAISVHRQGKPNKVEDVGWASLTWTDVDDLAREVRDQLDGRVDPIARYLLTELRRLLMDQELVFPGFLPQQLGAAAGHALSAYRAWYDLVKVARKQLQDYVVSKSAGRETLRRNFNGVGFDAVGASWDKRKVRRTKLRVWVGVYPFEAEGDFPTDWYAGAALYFTHHPQRLSIIEDRTFVRTARRFAEKHGFDFLPDEFSIRGDNVPAAKILREHRTPAAQQQCMIDRWEQQLRVFNESDVINTLLDYH